jgi:four helix bundle protein
LLVAIETENIDAHVRLTMSASYRDLRVWQSAMDMVIEVYKATDSFPRHEMYGLAGQMRRAAVSVPSNIAEGKGRLTDRDRAHFFSQARGSLLELETQIIISQRLSYLADAVATALLSRCQDAGRMLNALVESIRPREDRIAGTKRGLRLEV